MFPRGTWLFSLFSILLAGANGLTAGKTQSSAFAAEGLLGSRPNVVIVMTDDQGFAPIGRHGHPWIRTPQLDRWHDASLRFTRYFASPTCSPTRSAIMTGRHPMKNGITHTILERERMTLDAVTLPQVLQEAGYRTGIFGKWHLGDEAEYQPERRGFEETFIHGAGGIGQAYDCSCADAPKNQYMNPVLRHNGKFVRTEGYCTDLFFDAALGWINEVRKGEKPFFAYVTTNAPHSPYVAKPEDAKRFLDMGFAREQAHFYGMIENIDQNVGQMLDKLEQWKLLDDTLIIFLSDNGMTGGGPGKLGQVLGHAADGTALMPYNAGMKGLKGSVDEGGVRVPCWMRWDGKLSAGREVDRIVAHLDLMPTIAELAGAKLPPGQVEGRSLVPLMQGEGSEWSDRMLFDHTGRWPVGAEPNEFQWKQFTVRNQRFRLVGTDQLYDLLADPGQTKNVMDEHPDVVKAMKEAYDAWWRETRPMMVNETAPQSPTRPYHVWYEQEEAAGGIPPWKPRPF